MASALLNASQQIGGSLGLAILTAVATARFDAVAPRVPTPAALASATTSSYAYAFIVGALLLVRAAVIGGLLLRPRPDEPHAGELTSTDEAIDRADAAAPPESSGTIRPEAAAPSPGSVVRVMVCSGCHA